MLWRAVDKARSAGRVQSVAIRLVCERERERMDFTSATWFDVTAAMDTKGNAFDATLEIGQRLVTWRPARTSTPAASSTPRRTSRS